jgi:simple sugar transport system permease protein
VFQVAPFVLMIVVLALVNLVASPTLTRYIAALPEPLQRPITKLVTQIVAAAPAALGKPFERP